MFYPVFINRVLLYPVITMKYYVTSDGSKCYKRQIT